MSTSYRVYGNGGSGGPVDYSTVVATVSALTWTTSALAYPGDYTFAVRAFDAGTGYEEQNVDCTARLVLDASGNDITARPNPPTNVSAIAQAGGTALITWHYSTLGQLGAPTGFHLYLAPGSSASYAVTPTSAPYLPGSPVQSATLSGLADGTTYTVAVRSYNAVAEEPNTSATASIVGAASAPSDPDSLTAVATPDA